MATLDANLHGPFEDCTRQNFEDVFDKLNMWFMSHHLTYCLDSDAERNPSKKRLPEECARPARPTAPEHTTPPPKPRNTQTRSSRSARGSSESTNNIIADADSEDAAHEVVAYDRAQKKYRDKLGLWKYGTTIWKEDQAKIERITKERVKD